MKPLHGAFFLLLSPVPVSVFAQTIGTFPSVQPTAQTHNLILPATHTFQRLLRSGSTLTSGETAGNNLDFTGYVPIGGSSTNGYLSVSHETFPAGVTVLTLAFNPTNRLWAVTSSGNVAFPQADLGAVSAFCAGTVTPANRVMVCEETTGLSDGNGDGYNDDGWIIEIDPATRTVINQDGTGGADKLWALGRQIHEDVVIKPDQSVAYWSADNVANGYIYKFVPAVPGNFSTGQLFVLKTTSALGTGTWEPLANATTADRNNTVLLSQAAGAFNFSRVEGIEIGPDGKIYFASTTSGNIYRFRDNTTGVEELEVFVASTNYDVDGAGPYPPEPWGTGADNIAFDGEGNLWVLQDGGRNHIWVVAPDHTAANPKVRLFATTPAGSEPTGITFSPDYRFLFLSLQHPNGSNTTPQTDAAGAAVAFDNSTTVVIARKVHLGPLVALPLFLERFEARQKRNAVELTWKTSAATLEAFEIDRSTDGVHFSVIGSVAGSGSNHRYTDRDLPFSGMFYYRLGQRDANGKTSYSETRTVTLQSTGPVFYLYPTPARNKLTLRFTCGPAGQARITLVNAAGFAVGRYAGATGTDADINTTNLAHGLYYVVVETDKGKSSLSFVKQ